MSPSLASFRNDFFPINTREFCTLPAVSYFRRALCHPGLVFPEDPEEFRACTHLLLGAVQVGPTQVQGLRQSRAAGWNGCRWKEWMQRNVVRGMGWMQKDGMDEEGWDGCRGMGWMQLDGMNGCSWMQ